MGDDATLTLAIPEEAGASARALQKGPSAPRRSLFEEMFGVSAFADISNQQQQQPGPAQGSNALPWRNGETASLFDVPSHLMPPIETLFEPLISGFLRLRTVDDDEVLEKVEDGKVNVDNDDMSVDSLGDETAFVKASDVSTDGVLAVFVPLFKEIAGKADSYLDARLALMISLPFRFS